MLPLLRLRASSVLQGRQGKLAESSTRTLFGWLNSIFNRVDDTRVKEVGPDRACAEWLLRCGAGVRWEATEEYLRDYNSLPVGHYGHKILEIDCTEAAVMHIGFPHFRGVKKLRKAVFHKCHYMEDEAMAKLEYLAESLRHLQVSSCGNVTDEGVLQLKKLKNLEFLHLYDLLEVKNRKQCLSELQKALPKCEIQFPFAREEDRDS